MSVRTTLCAGALSCIACGSIEEPALSLSDEDSSVAQAPAVCVPPPMRMPALDTQVMQLSELGLFDASRRAACDLLTWEPRFPLWSDGADKKRWLRLPAGAIIDTADPEHFRFPVGSVLFKEFALAGKRLETRVIARLSERDTFFGAFVWRDDESDADLAPAGAANVRASEHDVPNSEQCMLCHKGEPGRVLGLSAVQTPELARLPALAIDEALGYLHGNCGHCHNENGDGWRMASMTLRLSVSGAARVLDETVGAPLSKPILGRAVRVVAGDPDASALLARMLERGTDGQMPPLASEHVDTQGAARVRAWIAGLSAE
jgi:hypothetical protein